MRTTPSTLLRATLFSSGLLILAATSGGCVSKPTMHLNHAEITGAQVGFPPSLNVMMTIVIDVQNPNSYDVAIRAMRGKVVMGSGYPLDVAFNPGGQGVWLKSNAVTQIRVPMAIPIQLALTLVKDAMTTPTIQYHLTGKADVTATSTFKIEKDDYEVDETGTITRAQIESVVRGAVGGVLGGFGGEM